MGHDERSGLRVGRRSGRRFHERALYCRWGSDGVGCGDRNRLPYTRAVIPRYTPPDIAAVFSEDARLQQWLQIELLACEGWAQEGTVPTDALDHLRALRVDVDRVRALEAEQGHDVAAFVSALQESAGPAGRWIHLGLTSSDIVDTALAAQLRDALRIVDSDAGAVEEALADAAVLHRRTVMVGRTHGVHAEPFTLGVKLAAHFDEVRRARRQLSVAAAEIAVGQISGAVGTHATVPPIVEEHVCAGMGLAPAPVATQVLARDRHAAVLCAMAVLGAVIERLATTVRLLQITEVDEVREPFSLRQKGSSAMPHKRNPILAERLCGLARVLRGHAVVGLENVALWHERDITHSSSERIVLPDACAVLAYMLRLAGRVVVGLEVDAMAMRTNLERHGGVVFSQQVLTALIRDGGWSRERAYRLVQGLARRARAGEQGFRALVDADPQIGEALAPDRLAACFDSDAFVTCTDATFQRLGLDGRTVAPARPAADGMELAAEANLGGGRLV